MHPKKIAIVCAHWPVHVTVQHIAEKMLDSGYAVNIVRHNAANHLTHQLSDHVNLCEIETVDRNPFSVASTGSGLLARTLRKVGRITNNSLLFWRPQSTLFSSSAMKALSATKLREPFQFVIAVEKGGLALAKALKLDVASSIVYYSLELYTREHPLMKADARMRALWRLEQKYSPNISVVVIQDEHRMEVLRNDLQLPPHTPAVLFPVSETAEPVAKSSVLRDRLHLPEKCKILLYFGVVRPERGVLAIAERADLLPENWVMVFHGPCNDQVCAMLESSSRTGRVRVSREMVSASDRALLVASADIGLAIYGGASLNDVLTGYSSEKIALYLKCGLPIIAKRNKSYEHIEVSGAGVLVNEIKAVPEAVRAIESDLSGFANSARKLFEKSYTVEENVAKLIEEAEHLVGGRPQSRRS